MENTFNSLSDVRITSLITTSITDMVRQEVGKIMKELNMPVCIEAIDRIIAENLDKEVEKQNFIKTYKRKLNKVSQYKCVEKRADPVEIVISNLEVIESRVKKLEDFVLHNLMQRPQLMQDLAVRSREHLEQRKIEGDIGCECVGESGLVVKNDEDQKKAVKPMLLNLDDVIKVIRKCPETQDSFDLFQSAAERIKHDLERFIHDYKSDLGLLAAERGQEDLETKSNLSSAGNYKEKHFGKSKHVKIIEADTKSSNYMIESLESVALVTTGHVGCGSAENALREANTKETAEEPSAVWNMREAKQEIVRPSFDQITKVGLEATTDLRREHQTGNPKNEKGMKVIAGEDQQELMTSLARGDMQIVDSNEAPKSLNVVPPAQTEANTKVPQVPKHDKEFKQSKECEQCRECTERRQQCQECAKPYAIDEDIKSKLDKILDHIGDFCSRTRGGGKKCISEPVRKTVYVQQQPQQPQPGTSAEFTKRITTKSGMVKPKVSQYNVKRSTGLNGKYDRKNLEQIMAQIRYMGHHVNQGQEVVITDAKAQLTPSINTNSNNINTTTTTIKTNDQPTKSKIARSIEQPRRSVEAFKTKWRREYRKNSIGKAAANVEHSKNASRSAGQAGIPKSAMKRRPQERSNLQQLPLHLESQLSTPYPAQQAVQKSSTTLMLESIDHLARSAAATNARIAPVSHTHNDIGWVYSRRSTPQAPLASLSEIRRTKVLYHNYKL